MEYAKPIPNSLAQRYRGWKATGYEDNKAWYANLAEHGQHPRTMVVSCCDSRVHVTAIFGVDTGEIFIHRNIANLIPPFVEDSSLHGTSAAIEYAVSFLKVTNLLVLGHSNCGGVAGGHDLCEGTFDAKNHFLTPWLKMLKPGYERAKSLELDRDGTLEEMERQSVLISLENLMTFPFINDAVKAERLTIHGLWHNIGTGELLQYVHQNEKFEQV